MPQLLLPAMVPTRSPAACEGWEARTGSPSSHLQGMAPMLSGGGLSAAAAVASKALPVLTHLSKRSSFLLPVGTHCLRHLLTRPRNCSLGAVGRGGIAIWLDLTA